MKDLGKDWAALNKWSEANGGKEYISEKFGDAGIGAYTKAANIDTPKVETRKYSFKTDNWKNMTYAEFLEKQEQDPLEVSMKIDDNNTEWIKDDIEIPGFYKNVADLETIEFF